MLVFIAGLVTWFLIYPNISKKASPIVKAATVRPGKTYLIDITKNCFGMGEVRLREILSPYQQALSIATSSTILKLTYFRWEIEPIDVFDHLIGQGDRMFIVVGGREKLEGNNEEILRLRKELSERTKEKEVAKGREKVLEQSIDFGVDKRVDDIVKIENKLKKEREKQQ